MLIHELIEVSYNKEQEKNMKNLIFCFDGTSNDPADAAHEETSTGGVKDSSVSNILKLHLLFGGDLKDGNAHGLQQLSLYYPGVGTYGNKLKRIINAGLALKDPGRIINEAINDLKNNYQPGDRIFIFGFSRGAAIARRFAAVINKGASAKYKIRFMGVFDTVASIGMPDMNTDEKIASDVQFENRTLSANVKEVLHLCSIDDKRKAFQPTLINTEDRTTELWFAGAHSDVGGSYHRDGLSDNTLRFMLDELARRKLGLITIAPSEVKYKQINASKDDLELEFDDLVIEPNVFGKNHQQSRPWLISKWTLYDRKVVVIENDRITKKRPKIHHSVAERIYGDIDYRPAGLKNRKHQVIYADNTDNNFDNLGHHVRVGMRSLRPLKKGQAIVVPVMAHQYHNRTGVLLERGSTYSFKVKPGQQWKDGGIECDANGWKRNRPDINWIKELAIKGMEPFRREADADWFTLIGAVGDSESEHFIIGSKTVKHLVKKSDEFCPFANDLKRLYGNNEGRIYLTVTRID